MKTFKGYLTEKTMKPHHSQYNFDTNELIFDRMDLLPFVLSTPALERAFGGLTRIKAWHLTDIDGLEGVVELQGKKASISAITEIGHRAVFNGVLTDGEVVVELEGTQLISADVDIHTIRLEAGRRAMAIDEEMYPILYKDMERMRKQMFKKYHNIMIKLPDYEKLDYALFAPNKKLPKTEQKGSIFGYSFERGILAFGLILFLFSTIYLLIRLQKNPLFSKELVERIDKLFGNQLITSWIASFLIAGLLVSFYLFLAYDQDHVLQSKHHLID